MPQRRLVNPPPGLNIGPLYESVLGGSGKLTDYGMVVWEHPDAPPEAPTGLVKGGWGDPESGSCTVLAMQTAHTIGRAAIVGNKRKGFIKGALGVPYARTLRSQAVYEGIRVVTEEFGESEQVIVIGHSFGGNNAVDAVNHVDEHMPEEEHPQDLKVLTIGTPGVHGDLKRKTSIARGLVGLTANVMHDFAEHSEVAAWLRERMSFPSAFEPLYFGSEFVSLLHIDSSPGIKQLRGNNREVWHAFYDRDVVPRSPGIDPFTAVFEGGHGKALVDPKPVVDFLAKKIIRSSGVSRSLLKAG